MKPCLSTLFDQYDGLWGVFTVKKDTTFHNVLTYRVMPVCKYSHTRTCMCAMCRHLISICFMTSVVFSRKYLDSCHVHAQVHTLKGMSSHTFFSYGDVSEYSWQYSTASHYCARCEGTINVICSLSLKTLLGCVYVQLLTYEDVSVCISLSWSPRMHTNVQ